MAKRQDIAVTPSSGNVRTGRSYRTDRTEGISDGVFAVSLTLLILDVRPPEGDVSQLVHGLVSIAPRLGTFALSFAIVAYYWLVHHLLFASLRGVKIALIWANMLFLFTIAVLPFSTAVLGRYSFAPPALAIYGANLAACTSTLAGVWFVAHHSHLTTTYSQPTTLHCAALRCSVDRRAAGDRIGVHRSGTGTEHLRRAADCVRADLPPAVLLTVVVHGATRHRGRLGRHG
jgi:uncharacterized membrane protein